MNFKPFLFVLAAFLVFTSFTQAFDISSGKGSTAYGYYYATGTPDKAWDSDNSTASEWITNSGASYDSNNTVDLNGTYTYSVTNAIWRGYDGSATYGFSKLYIYYSNDNSTWTLAQAITGNTLGQRQFNFSAIQARYWRLTARDQYGDGNYGYTSYAGIYGTIYVSGDSLTIANPTNTTIVNSSVTLTYNFSSVVSSNATCYRVIDGTSTLLGTVASNTSNSYELTGLSIGSHNATVTCQPYTGANVSTSTLFTRLDWLVNGNQYTTPVYEISNNTLVGSINTSTNVAILSAGLYYNGTSLTSLNTSVTQTDRQSNVTYSFIVPILQVNNTNASFYWSFNLSWSNGTTITVNTSTVTQANIYAYSPGAYYLSTSSTGEAQPVNATLTVTNYTNTATIGVVNYLNASIYGTASANNTNYTSQLTTPLIGVTSVTFYPYATLSVTYGGNTRYENSSNLTLTVGQLSLNNCSSSTVYGINFTFKDEEPDGNTNVNSTMGGTFTITDTTGTLSRSYNFTWTNVTTASVCISPANSVVYVTSTQDYYSNYAGTYPVRHYYLANASINTTTPTSLKLYLLSSTYAKLTQIVLLNSAGVAREGYTIQITRYYPGLNQYLLIAMGVTNQNGETGIYLRPNDAQFKMYAYLNSTLTQTFSPAALPCDPSATACSLTLTLTGSSLTSYLTKGATLAYSCDNSTSGTDTLVTCTYSDPTSSLSLARLQVLWVGNYANNTACYSEATTSAGSLICNLGNATYKDYTWTFQAGFSPLQTYDSAGRYYTRANQYGATGYVIMILTVASIGLLGMTTPVNGMIGVGVALLFGQLTGFLFISYGALMGILAVIAILVYNAKQ